MRLSQLRVTQQLVLWLSAEVTGWNKSITIYQRTSLSWPSLIPRKDGMLKAFLFSLITEEQTNEEMKAMTADEQGSSSVSHVGVGSSGGLIHLV